MVFAERRELLDMEALKDTNSETYPLVDAHCHIGTRSHYDPETICNLNRNKPTIQCIMSNNVMDWNVIKEQVLEKNGSSNYDMVKVGFGVHPWYSHLFSAIDEELTKREHYENVLQYNDQEEFETLLSKLPEPVSLELYIKENFIKYNEKIDVVGEIGLDKLFRLPQNGFHMESKTPIKLTKIKVKMSHQVSIFTRLCQLAAEYKKPVSIHDVKCHANVFDTCIREFLSLSHSGIHGCNICLHSYTGSIEMLESQWFKKFPKEQIFISLSNYINLREKHKLTNSGDDLIKAISLSTILTETDYPVDTDGRDKAYLDEHLEKVYDRIRDVYKMENMHDCKKVMYNNLMAFLQ
ncbi:putative endodeoxyribonuclease NDAI_0K00580 [Naumovozyma dairenensis CBS 421]|uniref:Uncharacterized protein n=1 Tax=Naumovozyma dairenensis (strain ATCC 10597 / BCRC 20456 / CBS 421 / NBRC 0211 / NRRL Y-12639) TaxID=1071378 RepID=G0WHI8_NAUDC|nr:hypothetical protein NDAI_0K00580 [Naumovozyma dairenensis CBS 421]CCD27249.1 hypothetical protein NDAI_0K00580 [Naumovozyma dairenensis CBS 421]